MEKKSADMKRQKKKQDALVYKMLPKEVVAKINSVNTKTCHQHLWDVFRNIITLRIYVNVQIFFTGTLL